MFKVIDTRYSTPKETVTNNIFGIADIVFGITGSPISAAIAKEHANTMRWGDCYDNNMLGFRIECFNENGITMNYEHTGEKVRNIRTKRVGVVLREFVETGSVQVLESIEPYIICTHEGWATLERME